MDFFDRLTGFLGDALLPEDVRAGLERAARHLARNEFTEAADEAARVLAKAADAPRAHAVLGLAKRGLGELEPARAALREAVRRNPGDATVHLALAEVELSLRDPARALLEGKKALDAGAPIAEATALLASAHDARGETTEALAALEALPDKHHTIESLERLAELRLALRDPTRAAATFRAVLARSDRRARSLAGLAEALLAAGDAGQALPFALRALSEDPQNPRHAALVGEVHQARGSLDGAAAAFARALELDPNEVRALRGGGRLSFERGDTAHARELFARWCALAPNDPEAQAAFTRAEIAERMRREAHEREQAAAKLHERGVRPDDVYAALVRAEHIFEADRAFADLGAAVSRLRLGYDRPLLLAIAGEFNAGKSTVLNALVGDAVAPMGVTPTTAAVNVFVYGPRKAARVVLQDGGAEEVPFERVVELIDARRGAGGGAVRHVEIVWPAESLREVSLVDTPGYNAPDEQHEAVARTFLEQADAVLWTFDASHAGTASERSAIEALGPLRGKVVGVLNKADRLSQEDRAMVLTHMRTAFEGEVADWVFVSAREALEASRTNDAERRAQSGHDTLWALLDERFFARARAAKRGTTSDRLRPILADAQRRTTELRGAAQRALEGVRARREGARLLQRHLTDTLGARLDGWWSEALRSAITDAAASAAELTRRRQNRLTALLSSRLAPEDIDYVSRILRDHLSAALRDIAQKTADEATRVVQAEVDAWRTLEGTVADRGRATLDLSARRVATIGGELERGPFASAAAYLRGWFDGGGLRTVEPLLSKVESPSDARRALETAPPRVPSWREALGAWAALVAGAFVELASMIETDLAHEAERLRVQLEEPLAGISARFS
jgi:tetratricopeptide (TPR) repeat protein